MGGEHSGIGDDTTTRATRRRVLESRGHPGQDAPPRLHERRRLSLRARRRLRAAARAPSSARPQLILAICGGRAGPLSDVQGVRCRARDPVRVRTARVARLLGVALSTDADRRRLHAPGLRVHARRRRFHRDAAVVSLRSRDRGGLRRGSRADPRLRHRFPPRPARTSHAHAARSRRPRGRSRSLRKRDWSTRDWQEIVTFSFVDVAGRSRARSVGARRSAC